MSYTTAPPMSDEPPSDLSAGSGLVRTDDGAAATAPTAAAEPPAPEASPTAPTAAVPPAPAASPTAAGSVKAALRHPSYVFLTVVTIVNLVADLVTKGWAKGYFEALTRGKPREVVLIDGLMSIIYAKNRGGAWGLLQNENDSLRRPFFLIVSVVAIVFIVSLYRKLAPGQTALKWGLPLVLGGALGNLVDRIRYGFVVDFIDVYMSWGGDAKHWPTFNVADVSICVGVGLMAIDMFTSRKPAQPASTLTPNGPPSTAQPAAAAAGLGAGPVLGAEASLDAPGGPVGAGGVPPPGEQGPVDEPLAETLLSAGGPVAEPETGAPREPVSVAEATRDAPLDGGAVAEPGADAAPDQTGPGSDDGQQR